MNSSFDTSCTHSQAPPVTQGDNEHLTYDDLRCPCRLRRPTRKDSEAVLKARPAPVDPADWEQNYDMADGMDTPEILSGKRDSAWQLGDAMSCERPSLAQ